MKNTFTYMPIYRVAATLVAIVLFVVFLIMAVVFGTAPQHPDLPVIGLISNWIIIIAMVSGAWACFAYLMKVYTWRLEFGTNYLCITYWPSRFTCVRYSEIISGNADLFGLHIFAFNDIPIGFTIPTFITNRELVLVKLYRYIGLDETHRALRSDELIDMLESGENTAALFQGYNHMKIVAILATLIIMPFSLFNTILAYPYVVALPVSLCFIPFLLWLSYRWRRFSWLEGAEYETGTTASLISILYVAAILSPLVSVWRNFSLHPGYVLFPFALILSVLLGLLLWRYGFFNFRCAEKVFTSLILGLSLPVYFYTSLITINTVLDTSTPTPHKATITEVFHPGKSFLMRPNVALNVWEGTDHPTADITPTVRLLDRLAEGNLVELDVHSGFLGIPWHQCLFTILNDHEMRVLSE